MMSSPFTTSAPTEQDPALVLLALSLPILIEMFDAKRQNEFSRGVALTAGVQRSEVAISCIRDVQRVDRRGLPTRGIHVDVIIEAQNMQSATIIVSKLTESSIDAAMQDSGFAGVKIVRNATAILRHLQDSSTLAMQEDLNERSQTTPTPIENSSHSDDLINRGLMTILGIVVVATCCCCSACLECFRQIWNKAPVASNKRSETPLLPVKPNLDRTESSRLYLSRVVFDQESPEQTPIAVTRRATLDHTSFISRCPLEQHQTGGLQKVKRLSADLGLLGPGAPALHGNNRSSDLIEQSPEQTNHLYPPIVATRRATLEIPSFISRCPLEQHQAGSSQKVKRLSADLGLLWPAPPGNTTSDLVVRFEVITAQL
jgi:hypothetical protein